MVKNKIGILYLAAKTPEYIHFLNPWIKLKEELNIVIAGANGLFLENHELGESDDDEETIAQLMDLRYHGKLDFLYVQNDPAAQNPANFIYQTEAEIRDYALQYLLEQGCSHIWMVDSDEEYTEQEIRDVIEYIQKPQNKLYTYFKIEFKNLFGDNNHYLKGFCPNRIWVVNYSYYQLKKVIYDNNMGYSTHTGGQLISDEQLSFKRIPLHVCNCKHHSWNDLERSRGKISYQNKRWSPPNGNGCSFEINEDKKCIQFSESYHKRLGIPYPEIFAL